MYGGMLRVLEIGGDASARGRAHGEQLGPMIRRYLEDRITLSAQEQWSGGVVERDLIIETAIRTLEHHERYSPELYVEMTEMAAAAGISPAEAVVVGGFTDLVDVIRSRVGVAPN